MFQVLEFAQKYDSANKLSAGSQLATWLQHNPGWRPVCMTSINTHVSDLIGSEPVLVVAVEKVVASTQQPPWHIT